MPAVAGADLEPAGKATCRLSRWFQATDSALDALLHQIDVSEDQEARQRMLKAAVPEGAKGLPQLHVEDRVRHSLAVLFHPWLLCPAPPLRSCSSLFNTGIYI